MGDMERLRWRCRRGMLELDLLLQGFLEKGYAQLDAVQKENFSRLLELPDQTLSEYLLGTVEIKEKEFIDVIERIRHAATA
jgi:antitoxin CptB